MVVLMLLFMANLSPIVNANHSDLYINETLKICPYYKIGPNLDTKDLVGSWMTVYTQPKAVNCFTLLIRTTTDLEREQYKNKYGNFSDSVNWDLCLLEIDSPLGKHFLLGDGTLSGLMINVIIAENKNEFSLHEYSADQWIVFGRRGRELVMMRDCSGEAAVVFARSPYWPSLTDLYSILHRSGVTPLDQQKVICEPMDVPIQQCTMGKGKNN